jgi:hypothetical protein
METNDNKNPGNKKWNNEQELNEGFSGENLAPDYNKENEVIARMTPEIETDQFGYKTQVMRDRFPHQHDEVIDFHDNAGAIENKKSLENRDRNYDTETNRYPNSHPDNHQNRGNIKLDE